MPSNPLPSSARSALREAVTHEAGRELDALIAEKVMGWTWFVRAGDSPSTLPDTRELLLAGEWPHTPRLYAPAAGHERVGGNDYVPNYSTDIAAAWLVVEKLRCTDEAPCERYWEFRDCSDFGWRADYCAVFTENDAPADVGHGTGETLPLAICRAAIAATTGRDE